mmetsp:Transcript_66993/g.117424  ORF Transcript_66993/g.117424 Transcript_66993/m.117424 type:complete len:1214 (+) Transcript_66993:63-3704(+)
MKQSLFLILLGLSCSSLGTGLQCKNSDGANVECQEIRMLEGDFISLVGFVGIVLRETVAHIVNHTNHAQNLLPGYEIVIDTFDTAYNQKTGLKRYVASVAPDMNKYLMYLGGDSTSVEQVGTIAPEYRMPYVGWNRNPKCGDREALPSYFNCQTLPGRSTRPFFVEMILAAGWKRMAFVMSQVSGANDVVDSGLKADLISQLGEHNVTFPVLREYTRFNMMDLRLALRAMHEARLNVLLFGAADFPALFCAMVLEKIAGLTILSMDYMAVFNQLEPLPGYEDVCTRDKLAQVSKGLLGFSKGGTFDKELTCMPGHTNTEMAAWWKTRDAELRQQPTYDGFPTPGMFVGFVTQSAYDTICIAMMGLRDMLFNKKYSIKEIYDKNVSTYNDLLHSLQNVKFEGSGGTFEFVDGSPLPVFPQQLWQIKNRSGADLHKYYVHPGQPPSGLPGQKNGRISNVDIMQYVDWSEWPEGKVPKDTWENCKDGEQRLWGECMKCDPGFVQKWEVHGGICTPCPAGDFCKDYGCVACDACEAGRFSDQPGSSECTECPAGTAAEKGESKCNDCQPGTFTSETGKEICKLCSRGEFQSENGRSGCEPCPHGTTTALSGTKSVKHCVCEQGTFHYCEGTQCDTSIANPNTTGFCQSCPEGADCVGPADSPNAMITDDGQHRRPHVQMGYMSLGTSVYKCGGDGSACPGSFMFAPVHEMCKHSGEGIACADCPKGHLWDDHSCAACEDGSWLAVLLLPLALVLLAGLFIFYWNEKSAKVEAVESVLASVTIGVTISFMQSVGVFSRLDFAWPVDVSAFMDIVKVFVFDMKILRLGCVLEDNLAMKTVTSLLMPIVVAAVFLAWYPLSWLIHRLVDKFRGFNINALLNALGMILQAFYISMVLSVVSGFDCYSSPNGDSTLRVSPSNVCWQGDHIPIVIASSIGGVVYVIGFFAGLTYVVIKAPVKILDPAFALRFKFVFFKYSPTAWWFAVPMMVRSVLIAMVTVASPNDGYMQFLLMLFILVSFGFWHLSVLPYADRYANNLETAELGILILILGFGSWFMSDKSGRSNADEDPDQAAALSVVLVVFLAVCILMVVVVFAYAMYIACEPDKVEKKRTKKLEAMLPSVRQACDTWQSSDDKHLVATLLHANYLEIGALASIVDYITVEVGGNKADAFKRQRLPRSSSNLLVLDPQPTEAPTATDQGASDEENVQVQDKGPEVETTI